MRLLAARLLWNNRFLRRYPVANFFQVRNVIKAGFLCFGLSFLPRINTRTRSAPFFGEDSLDLIINKLDRKASLTTIILYSSETNKPVASGFLINDSGDFITVSNIFPRDAGTGLPLVSTYHAKLLGNQAERYSLTLQCHSEEENLTILRLSSLGKNPKFNSNITFPKSPVKGQTCFVFTRTPSDFNTIESGILCENSVQNLDQMLEGHFSSPTNMVANIENNNTCAYGAPAFDSSGNLLGMILPVNPKVLRTHTVLMPSDHLEAILEQYTIRKEIKRPYIGVSIKTGITVKGAFVIKVNTGAPSSQAGIRLGDTIIAVNGLKIDTAEQFFKALGYKKGIVRLTVERDGKTREVNVDSVYS